ncbi:MAG: sigma-54 dependent transcriptional regulator [Acidobacteriota bacterium]|nr:sigma-54 dependent transcriptional regulator [Acidobacteriota bacterium]
MFKILVVDSSAKDAAMVRGWLGEEGAEVEVCPNGEAAKPLVETSITRAAAVFLLWELTDLSFAETLALFRLRWPETPVVVMFEEFTAELAGRAIRLGAKDVLQKPLEAEAVKACWRELLAAADAGSPLIARLRETIRGESASLVAALRELAKVIPHKDSRILLLGESGTGKELFAQAIHDFGANADQPLVAVQISAINENLIESQLFGHERGAFTGADRQHIGFFEQAGGGTLFLDEVGDLSDSAQIRLLRVIQERKFFRLNGSEELPFRARLICATHRNLAEEVSRNHFRLDLFQRIREVTIYIPPLRERKGDIQHLAIFFLDRMRAQRQVRFADETLKILCGYSFPGNVRELQNVVKSALIACAGEVIRPQHLPMGLMNDLLPHEPPPEAISSQVTSWTSAPKLTGELPEELINELTRLLPADWLTRPYREATKQFIQAFDRVYLRKMLDRHRYNLTAAAKTAELDRKTFRERWKQAELPPLGGEEEKVDE